MITTNDVMTVLIVHPIICRCEKERKGRRFHDVCAGLFGTSTLGRCRETGGERYLFPEKKTKVHNGGIRYYISEEKTQSIFSITHQSRYHPSIHLLFEEGHWIERIFQDHVGYPFSNIPQIDFHLTIS